MAEAEILRVMELLDSFLNSSQIDETNTAKASIVFFTKRVINDLRLFLDLVEDEKLEERINLKYWIFDVVEIANEAYQIIHHIVVTNNSERWSFIHMSVFFEPMFRGLSKIREYILQHGIEGVNKSPITSPFPPQGGDEYVVGLEQDVESVLGQSILCEENIGLSTTCIVGMAGIGKTTLAREIYNHTTVIERFECRVWACVSGPPSNKAVLMKLLSQVLHNKDQSVSLEEMENEDNNSLQSMLRQHLQGKKFLIALDDMGKVPYVKSIFEALPDEDNQSRLLVTSQFQSIKERLKCNGDVYSLKMKPLDDDRSWQLFLKLLLFGNQQFPKKLEKKGREMLRSCAGLPLSIKEVATQFVIKRQSGSEWEELLESIDLSATIALLESVYNTWPPQLKSCFLCLCFFKKGIPIKRWKLVQVWAAGQVIPQEQEEYKDFEKVKLDLDSLEEYKTTLMKLFDESIIEVDISRDRRIKCIRVNESFHTLSMAKAEEEMVFETIKRCHGNLPSSKEPRHRAIYCTRDKYNHFMDHDERLVSIFFRGGGYFDASETYWKRFEQLRTLDFEGFGLKMLPESIGALTELRYLGLRDNYIQELPQSLGHLKYLEVLDIALNFAMEVSDIVWEISSLRHLYMSDIICPKPLKIDALKNLKTLTYISVNNWTYEASTLEMMTGLRKLGIEEVDENSDVSKLFASLANLRNLDCLILRGFRFRSLPSLHGLETLETLSEIKLDGLITKLPSANIFPPKLNRLTLINSCLDEDPMPELGKLIYLNYLKLKNAYTGQKMVIHGKGLFSLSVLCIEELWHLTSIQVESTIWVNKLEIKNCPYLEDIPKGISTAVMEEVKMITTRKHVAKIRKWDFISKLKPTTNVDIQP